jgi:hypothetical protein
MAEENFIRLYKNAASPELSGKLIDRFNELEKTKRVFGRQSHNGDSCKDRSDNYIFLDRIDLEVRVENELSLGTELLESVSPYMRSYCENFGLGMSDHEHLTLESIKMQKIRPGQGYHMWHHEHGPGAQSARVLVWMYYCNTISDGGETEFLFQRMRIKPEANTLLVWPASFTHTHRGGLVLGDEPKYIVTGWLRYNNWI